MKKLLSFIFAGVILFNTCGDFFLLKYQQFVAKHEMKEMIRSGFHFSRAILITVITPENNPDFNWVERGEFRYKGKLFDVVSEKVSGNIHYFTCINDKSEETLISNYTRNQVLTSHMGSPDKSRHQRVLIHLLIKHALVGIFTFPYPVSNTRVEFPHLISWSASLHTPPGTPPPELS
jgi:hypothetical protein